MKNILSSLLFVLFLLSISFYYRYQDIVFKRPQSIHKWRQADCASLTLNYYQGGMHFFYPEVNNLTSDGGTSGKSCTSEIPLLYYTVALLYRIFGYHEYIYRIFNTIIFFTGLFFLFKLLQFLIKDFFWAASLSLLFFTSPVLVYYGNNFLTNSAALALSMIAWYYFIRFIFEKKHRWFIFSVIFFFLAGACKVTALFSLIAITAVFLLEVFHIGKFGDHEKLFKTSGRYITAILIVYIIIGSWLAYASYYNREHDSTYFSTTIFPIWNLISAQIRSVLDEIRTIWLQEYFHFSVFLFIVMCFLFILLNFKKNNPFLIYYILIILAEVIIYLFLEFWTFKQHDYYTIDIYILPVLIIISAFDVLKRDYARIFGSVFFKIMFLVFLIFNISYAHSRLQSRYSGWMNDYSEFKDIYTITPYLRLLGISSDDKVISIPDPGHSTLYLMNQKGWTEYIDSRLNRGVPIYYNRDSAGIQLSVNKGAKYLILNNIEELFRKPYLQSFCTHLIGRYNNVLIFQLDKHVPNFNLSYCRIEDVLSCDAETVSSDSNFYIGDNHTIFKDGNTRSNDFSYRGNYSCRLDSKNSFGMRIKVKNLEYGESFKVSVWRKKVGSSGGFIIASGGSYYNNESNVVKRDLFSWEEMNKEFLIPNELVGKEVEIYLYNPSDDPVYYDDLMIIRYKNFID